MRVPAILAVSLAMLAGCHATPPQALGSLEYDRISLPAPVAERIVQVDVREGQQVAAGARLMVLDTTRTAAQAEVAQADVARQEGALRELEVGPRMEAIARARAQLAAAQAQAREAQAYYARLQPLGRRKLVAAMDVDRARAAAQTADAQVRTAMQGLDELLHGTRPEDIEQGRAAVLAAQAQARVQDTTLGKLIVIAPRAGRIDSLPYKLGDQAPVGSPLVVMLVGASPYARVYIPETRRAGTRVGDALDVQVEGHAQAYRGTVRMIRNDPVFTPYFALTGKDAARLSYLAEVQLGSDATGLPAGLPVHVSLPAR